MFKFVFLLAALLSAVEGFSLPTATKQQSKVSSSSLNAVNGIWNTAGDFGKGKFRFYEGLDSYMKPFPGKFIIYFLCISGISTMFYNNRNIV